jgi:hypothetical protein
MYTFTPLNGPFGNNSGAFGINDRGQVVGSYDGGGFVYDNGVYTTQTEYR